MKNIFKEAFFSRVKYSTFDLSHDRKFSTNMGKLTPVMCMEVLPGDKFNVTAEQMIRFAPMLAPVMHRIDVFTHYFFVPNRIVWQGWENFISPDDLSNVPEFPTVSIDNPNGSLADYLGLPSGILEPVSAIPAAAYAKIYNEYYRDQNLIDPITDTCEDGAANPDLENLLVADPLLRAWEHDYFTACLPFAQKGDPVTIPLGDEADILWEHTQDDVWRVNGSNTPPDFDHGGVGSNPALIQGGTGRFSAENTSNQNYDVFNVDNSSNLKADLSTATAITINDLRRAIRLQEWLEKNARGGTRYIESNLIHFGVRSSDARLQRPEYLGGGKSPVMISEVVQSSANDAEPTPIGTMAGHGLNVGESNQFKRRFEEHGYVIGIMSVMPKTSYYQGIPRHFLRKETLDFPFPSFAHIGEQEVYNKEIFAQHTNPDGTFGYIPRYSEMRYQPNTIHGDFRSTLLFWSLTRDLSNDVALNADFISADVSDRIFAVQDGTDTLWCHLYNKVYVTRALPKYGTPRL